MIYNLTYGTPLRGFLDDYFNDCDCEQEKTPYNRNFTDQLLDEFYLFVGFKNDI